MQKFPFQKYVYTILIPLNTQNQLHVIYKTDLIMLRENLLIFPCVLFGTYLFVNFHI